MAINAFHYSIRKQRNHSNHRTLQPTKTNSRPGSLGGGEWEGDDSRDISLPRFVSARETGRGEVFQLNADYIALSRYWKYIDNQADPRFTLVSARVGAVHPLSHNRPGTSWIFLWPGSSKLRSTTTRRYLDVSRTHGAKRPERRDHPSSPFFFFSGSFSLRRLFKPSAAAGRRLARFRFQCETSTTNGDARGKEEVTAGRRTWKISSRPALSYTPYRRKRDIYGRLGRNDPRYVN